MLIDSHAHLQDSQFAGELDQVLARARDAGVERMVCVGDRLDSSREAIALAHRYPMLCAAVGIHPQHEKLFGPTALKEIETLATDSHVVAIGEIGLDFYWKPYDAIRQIDCFVAQARLAEHLNLPIIVHCRDAYEELIETIRSDNRISRQGVIHCFSGTFEQARALIDEGYFLGIGGVVTFPNGGALREIVHRVGLDRIVCETDAPYLAPQAKRGKRNEPAYMTSTVEALAEAAGVDFHEAARITRTNATRLFDLPATAPETPRALTDHS